MPGGADEAAQVEEGQEEAEGPRVEPVVDRGGVLVEGRVALHLVADEALEFVARGGVVDERLPAHEAEVAGACPTRLRVAHGRAGRVPRRAHAYTRAPGARPCEG